MTLFTVSAFIFNKEHLNKDKKTGSASSAQMTESVVYRSVICVRGAAESLCACFCVCVCVFITI